MDQHIKKQKYSTSTRKTIVPTTTRTLESEYPNDLGHHTSSVYPISNTLDHSGKHLNPATSAQLKIISLECGRRKIKLANAILRKFTYHYKNE